MNNQDHMCFACGKSFCTREELVSHLNSHSESESFSCNICGKVFALENTLIEHLLSHGNETIEEQQQMHASGKHSGCKKQKNALDVFEGKNCHKNRLKSSEECSSNDFKNENSVITDDASLSADMECGTHACIVCEKKFIERAKLAKHLKRHHHKKENVCTICNKTYSDQYILKDHMVVHSGVKPYECEFCNMAFGWKPCLVVHRRKHTGEKPYLCSQCEWAFPTNTHLKRHIAEVHSNEKPFHCDVCGKAFSLQGRLREHMKNHGDSPTLQTLVKLGYSFPHK